METITETIVFAMFYVEFISNNLQNRARIFLVSVVCRFKPATNGRRSKIWQQIACVRWLWSLSSDNSV